MLLAVKITMYML